MNRGFVKNQWMIKFLSFACVIHCLLMPLVWSVFPLLGPFLGNLYIEVGLFFLSVVSGTYIIRMGYCRHQKGITIVLYGLGVMCWGVNLLCELLKVEFLGLEYALLMGSLLVLLSYYFNYRFSQFVLLESYNR
tara:strand:+ start:280 stop:678 length:399 start_codon:yes stop_codon:yes gene_type:complete